MRTNWHVPALTLAVVLASCSRPQEPAAAISDDLKRDPNHHQPDPEGIVEEDAKVRRAHDEDDHGEDRRQRRQDEA